MHSIPSNTQFTHRRHLGFFLGLQHHTTLCIFFNQVPLGMIPSNNANTIHCISMIEVKCTYSLMLQVYPCIQSTTFHNVIFIFGETLQMIPAE